MLASCGTCLGGVPCGAENFGCRGPRVNDQTFAHQHHEPKPESPGVPDQAREPLNGDSPERRVRKVLPRAIVASKPTSRTNHVFPLKACLTLSPNLRPRRYCWFWPQQSSGVPAVSSLSGLHFPALNSLSDVRCWPRSLSPSSRGAKVLG